MSWQNSINAPVNAQGEFSAKRFYGDPRLAVGYLPVAYALLGGLKNQMALSGISFGHRMVQLPDGTTIRVIRNGGDNIVEITTTHTQLESLTGYFAIYMESGYIDATSTREAFEQKNKIYDTESTVGEGYKDSLIPKEEIIFAPAENKSHAVPGGIGDKRIQVYNSLFSTGLLRRAIQALIGRADPTYTIETDEKSNRYGEQSQVNIETMVRANKLAFGINSSSSGDTWLSKIQAAQQTESSSRGVFRGDHYNYFYISIESGVVTAYPCSFGVAGTWIIKYINEHTDELSDEEIYKLETYALSDINVNNEDKFIAGTFSIIGTPIYNGWHFNSDGSEASIVTIEQVASNIGNPPMLRYLTTRLYTLTLKTSGEDSLSASLSLVEEENCTPRNGIDNVWIPFYIEAKMAYYGWVDQRGFSEPMGEYDAPIYCMYDKGDKLLVPRVQYKKNALPEAMSLQYFQQNVLRICGFGTRLDATYENLTSSSNSGLAVDNGNAYKKDDKTGSKFVGFTAREFTGQEYTVVVPEWDNVPWGLSSSDCGTIIEEWADDGLKKTLTRYGVYATAMYASTNLGVENNFIFVIPWYDANAFYCASSEEEQNRYYQVDHARYGFAKEHCINADGREMTRIISQNGFGELATGGGIRSDWQAVVTRPFNVTINIIMDLYYSNGVLGCTGLDYSADYENTSEITAVKGRWKGLIDPILFGPAAYPYFDLPFIVNQGGLDNLVYFDNPNVAAWLDGFDQKNIIDLDIEQPFTGMFSGWA